MIGARRIDTAEAADAGQPAAARITDVMAIARILWAFQKEADWLPRVRRPWTELRVLAWAVLHDRVRVVRRVDAVSADAKVEAFIMRRGDTVHALYTAASARRAGFGRMLVNEAKTEVENLRLWVAQDNAEARRFYAAMGFREVARSDGRGNDEGLPDILLIWSRAPSGIARMESQERSIERAGYE
ncbi:GNAT family N-acetyltransferase [Litorivita pollutaquae]|nr:GNAT family N-acetyltransferase [Litorivita pollutaquae]